MDRETVECQGILSTALSGLPSSCSLTRESNVASVSEVAFLLLPGVWGCDYRDRCEEQTTSLREGSRVSFYRAIARPEWV